MPEAVTERDRAEEARRAALLALVALLIDSTRHELDLLCGSLTLGVVGVPVWSERSMVRLVEGHTHAAYLGRRMAGREEPMDSLDEAFGQSVAEEQAPFLEKFAGAVEAGEYDLPAPPSADEPTLGEIVAERVAQLDSERIRGRAGMYADRLRGTFHEAWVLSLPAETVIHWKLEEGASERHCSTCPKLARNGPYTPETLPTFPGAGDTDCLTNCLCRLEVVDGDRPKGARDA